MLDILIKRGKVGYRHTDRLREYHVEAEAEAGVMPRMAGNEQKLKEGHGTDFLQPSEGSWPC